MVAYGHMFFEQVYRFGDVAGSSDARARAADAGNDLGDPDRSRWRA
jgi:hypothetical protein